jgi:hypothetical protein
LPPYSTGTSVGEPGPRDEEQKLNCLCPEAEAECIKDLKKFMEKIMFAEEVFVFVTNLIL